MRRARPALAAAVLVVALVVGAALPGCADEPDPPTGQDIVELAGSRAEYLGEAGDEGPAGRWRHARAVGDAGDAAPDDGEDGGDADADDGAVDDAARMLETLDTLGYAAGSRPAAGAVGVTVHDIERTHAGYNLMASGHAPEALLIDMDGRVVHRWSAAPAQVWPGRQGAHRPAIQAFRRAHLLPDGSLLALYEGYGLVKLDRDSEVVWAHDGAAHHDLDVLPDGRILVLERNLRSVARLDSEPVLDDLVVTLEPDGRPTARVSVLDAFADAGLEERYAERLRDDLRRRWGDLFHTNTLQAIDAERASWSPLVEEGDVVLSLRRLDLLLVLDLDAGTVTWSREGSWRAQHQPELLPDGRMLVFDNQGGDRRSSVLEFDPATGEVHWRVTGGRPYEFYSETCGSVQRLPNGNTLIVESDAGRAFEVTREQDIVWEFRSPFRAGEQNELVATLFDCVRVEADEVEAWLTR